MKHFAKRGFTLVELLMVIGIMGLLGGVATTGYYAAVRGMTDRGVRQDVISFLRAAQQRALSDETPTVVYVRNEVLREESADGMESEFVCGVLTSVRMAGRISYIGSGNIIVDEFADWDKTYDVGGNASSATPMRMYRLAANGDSALKPVSQSLSYVYPFVEPKVNWMTDPLLATTEYLQELNDNDNTFNADDTSMQLTTASKFSGVQFRGFPRPFGFKIKSGNSTWAVGDAYGFEIGSLRLPAGYIFGNNAPTKAGEATDVGNPILFDPATVAPGTCDFSTTCSLVIYARRPNGRAESVGSSITQSDLKDDQQK